MYVLVEKILLLVYLHTDEEEQAKISTKKSWNGRRVAFGSGMTPGKSSIVSAPHVGVAYSRKPFAYDICWLSRLIHYVNSFRLCHPISVMPSLRCQPSLTFFLHHS
jgi:hypothetical protein